MGQSCNVRIKHQTVFVEYRIKSGASLPKWRALRVRCVSMTPDGVVFGRDIIAPYQNNLDIVVAKVILILHDKIETIDFVFDSKLNRKPCRYTNMQYVEIPTNETLDFSSMSFDDNCVLTYTGAISNPRLQH